MTLLGGCSSTFFFLSDAVEPGPAPTDYRQLVAKDFGPLKARLGMGTLEISPVRPTRLAQPGDWFACVRTNIQERKVHYAVFMRDGKVTDRREAVVIDACPQEEFQPLPVVEATPAAAPAAAASSTATSGAAPAPDASTAAAKASSQPKP